MEAVGIVHTRAFVLLVETGKEVGLSFVKMNFLHVIKSVPKKLPLNFYEDYRIICKYYLVDLLDSLWIAK